ncbi:MAG: hypothetical protein ACRD3M_13485, partial [Thermoanaerobaculia bacterium]
ATLPSVRHARPLEALLCAGLAALAAGATDLLPAKVADFARVVETVRGHRFDRAVPAGEIDGRELERTLRAKLADSFPAPPEETRRTLVALGLIDDAPGLMDRLVRFYASQVIAFYDPEPRRFYVVRGAPAALEAEELEGAAEKLIFTHELTHALQDQNLGLDRRLKALKDNGDRALALQCLLEGEATLVMIRAALADLPGADETVEDEIAPLLSAGGLEKANAPEDVPPYFTEQLFFPYVEGTAYVRRAVKAGGWAEVDRLWKNPPVSTAEILHPEARPRVPATDLLPARTEGLAPDGFRSLYSDTLGEWGLRFLLRRGLPAAEADPAAAGWRGDRVAFFSSPAGGIAYLWRVRLESSAAAERLQRALRKSRQRNPAPEPETVRQEGVDLLISGGFPARGSGQRGR